MNKMRRGLVAGNWKMNQGGLQGLALAEECIKLCAKLDTIDVVLAPPYTLLAALANDCEESQVRLAAQNVHHEKAGAFTGDISAEMLSEAGCSLVIVGHSERRQFAHETDALVAAKCTRAFEAGLVPIVCVGESLEAREAGHAQAVVRAQLDALTGVLKGQEFVIAYEPIWAIGTGKTAGPKEAEEIHAMIREWLGAALGADAATQTRVLYGGSVKADNAEALFGCANIDGALVGGASLDAKNFHAIAAAAAKVIQGLV
jgi:triosephosphate isomerase (TIM)